MGFALQVLEPHQNGPAGEVPILVWNARAERATAISGQGPAPAAATIGAMRAQGVALIPPDGFLAAPVPAALDAWCLLLERFGTRRLSDVLAPARGLAERGFPMYGFLRADPAPGGAALRVGVAEQRRRSTCRCAPTASARPTRRSGASSTR